MPNNQSVFGENHQTTQVIEMTMLMVRMLIVDGLLENGDDNDKEETTNMYEFKTENHQVTHLQCTMNNRNRDGHDSETRDANSGDDDYMTMVMTNDIIVETFF